MTAVPTTADVDVGLVPQEGRLADLSHAVARGVFVNGLFVVGLQLLMLTQGLLVPRLLGPSTVGLFAVAVAVTSVGAGLKELGISEKLVQERHADLPLAYSVAFTLELIVSSVIFAGIVAAAPLVVGMYHRPELLPVIIVLGISIYTVAFLELPSSLYQRDLRYFGQNVVTAIQPVVAFAVTIPLALLGAGVWSLVLGAVAALVAAAAAVAWSAPLRPRLRVDRSLLRNFLGYGWPLWISAVLGLSTTIGGTIVISKSLGLAALGYFSVAQSMGQRVLGVDALLGRTLFPALCRAQDDVAGQRRAFVATNRVTAIWSGTVGFGLAVFAGDLVHLVLGARWAPGIFLFEMQGLAVVVMSIGWSWDVFFRARGETRPYLFVAIVAEAWVFVVLLPAAAIWGIAGAGWAVLSLGLMSIVVRQIPLRRLFPGINIVGHAWRELVATGAAAVCAVALRHVVGHPTSILEFASILVAYCVLVVAFLLVTDRAFLRELVRKVRGRRVLVAGPATTEGPLVRTVATIADVVDGHATAAPAPVACHSVVESHGVPGAYPLAMEATDDGSLWLTLRDSSSLARLDTRTGEWASLRLPAYPLSPAIDGVGRCWVALRLSSALVAVAASGHGIVRVRIPHGRRLVGAAVTSRHCVTVDGARRTLWRVPLDVVGRRRDAASAVALPSSLVHASSLVAADDEVWVTDRGAAQLVHVDSRDRVTLVPVHAPVRVAVADRSAGLLWLAHEGVPEVSWLDTCEARVPRTIGLPGPPAALAVDGAGTVWVAVPERDVVVEVRGNEVVEAHAVPLGGAPAPVSLASLGGALYVASAATDRLVVLK